MAVRDERCTTDRAPEHLQFIVCRSFRTFRLAMALQRLGVAEKSILRRLGRDEVKPSEQARDVITSIPGEELMQLMDHDRVAWTSFWSACASVKSALEPTGGSASTKTARKTVAFAELTFDFCVRFCAPIRA